MRVETEEFRNRSFPSFGQCIYCGAPETKTKLTNEHIVPLSLGGTSMLLKASCTSCAKITSQLELHLARNIFGHHRIHTNVATRNRKKRPSVLPATIKIGDNPAQDMEFSIGDHPYFTFLPVWKPPGILTGAPPTADFATQELHRFEFVPAHFRKLLSLTDADLLHFQPPIKLDQDQFSRALAKIAYCTTISRYGLNGCERTTIVDFILGKYPFAQYLVGGTTDSVSPPMPKNIDHAIALIETVIGKRNTIIATVRLFANTGTGAYGMPTYTVVVGPRSN
jgi:HNH endonuclease